MEDARIFLRTFWTLFSREPDSVLNTARRAYLQDAAVPIGTERPSLFLVNMRALAAHALLGDRATFVLGRNIAFVEGHPEEIKMLAHAGMTQADKLEDAALGGDLPAIPPGYPDIPGLVVSFQRPNPAMIKKYGPMGIWRTP